MSDEHPVRVSQWLERAQPWIRAYAHVYFALACISAVVLVSVIFFGVRSTEPNLIVLRPLPYAVRLVGMTALVIVTAPMFLLGVVASIALPTVVVWKAVDGLYAQFKMAVEEVSEND